MREPSVHVHDVGHECKAGKLVAEGATEEPKIGEGGVRLAEIVGHNCWGNIFFLDGAEGFETNGRLVFYVFLSDGQYMLRKRARRRCSRVGVAAISR